MSECQSKCACGDICRRVDEHLQHQCPKCSYEQRGTAENVAATPATPAATPLREANQQRVDAAAQRVRETLYNSKYLHVDPFFRKDVELLIEIALAPVLEIFAGDRPSAIARLEEARRVPALCNRIIAELNNACTKWGPHDYVWIDAARIIVWRALLGDKWNEQETPERIAELEHAIAMNSEAPQNLPAAAQPAATPMAWTPQVEVYRTELMRRFSNKLSMEEIADFSYWAAQPQRESEQP